MINPTTKRCSKCEEIKPLESFRNDRNRRDGRYPYCKACEKKNQTAKASTRTVTERYCPACQRTLLASAFSKNKTTQDGLMRYCKACDNRHAAEFRAANAELIKQSKAAYRAANPDKVREGKRRCYEAKRSQYIARNLANQRKKPEAARKSRTAWSKRNPAKVRELRMRYNARKVAATVESVDYNLIWQRDGGICHICGGLVAPNDIHFDHVIPLSKGGPHTHDNIKVSHSLCNTRKGAKL